MDNFAVFFLFNMCWIISGYQACFSNDFINVPEGGPVDPVTQLHMEFCVNMTGYSTLGPFGGKGGGKGKIKGPKKKGIG